MAELLSREKELFKINQELNLLTLSPAADAMYPAKGSSKSTAVAVPRFATFQKQKGPSSLLRNDADEANRKPDVVEVEVTQKRESTTVVNGQLKKQVTKDNFIK